MQIENCKMQMPVLSLSKDRLGQSVVVTQLVSVFVKRLRMKPTSKILMSIRRTQPNDEGRNEPRRNKLLNVITFDIYREYFMGQAAQPNNACPP